MGTFVDAFQFFGENPALVWEKTVDHIVLSAAAIAVGILVAVPLGVWLGHVHRGSFLAINASNIGRALPSLAVISIGLGLLGVGFVNVLVAMVILAVPPMLTNSYVAVDGVEPDAVEAAKGMGMRPSQVLLKVELPLALPLIFAGVRTAAVYVIATAALASIAGGHSLGDIILNQPTLRPRRRDRRRDRRRRARVRGRGPLRPRSSVRSPPRGLRKKQAGHLVGPAIEGV